MELEENGRSLARTIDAGPITIADASNTQSRE